MSSNFEGLDYFSKVKTCNISKILTIQLNIHSKSGTILYATFSTVQLKFYEIEYELTHTIPKRSQTETF